MENTQNIQGVMESLSAKAQDSGFEFEVDMSNDDFAQFIAHGKFHDDGTQRAEVIVVTNATVIGDIDWLAIEERIA